MQRQPARIAIVNSLVSRFDAISANVRDMASALTNAGHQVRVFCYHSDFDDQDFRIIRDNADLLLDDFFASADLLIWHFGIYYEAFNTVLFGNGHAPRAVCFHNVTPEEFVPEAARATIRRSMEQIPLLASADDIWPVSEINAKAAVEAGVAPDRVTTIPLQVDLPRLTPLASKAPNAAELLYVGRFTRAKGVLELLQAFREAASSAAALQTMTLAGNVSFSDPRYVAEIRQYLDANDLERQVTFPEVVEDEALFDLYRRSHLLGIASYHEGFCKPVIEALRSGCIPVGYSSYNIPYVAGGFGALVAPGDVQALADRLKALASALPQALARPEEKLLPLDRGLTSVAEFDALVPLHVAQYEPRNVHRTLEGRVRALLGEERAPAKAA